MIEKKKKKPDADDLAEQKLLTDVENNEFLKALRRHHPNGPLSYNVKNNGHTARLVRPADIRGGSPAGMCADAI